MLKYIYIFKSLKQCGKMYLVGKKKYRIRKIVINPIYYLYVLNIFQ